MENKNVIRQFIIDDAVKHQIESAIRKDLSAEPVMICLESNHPSDGYLYRYIAYRHTTNDYIAGSANTSRHGCVGLYNNHYNVSLKKAFEITAQNIWDIHEKGGD